MMSLTPPQTTFLGGEMSPKLFRSGDAAKRSASCDSIENFVVLTPGYVTRRQGTRYVAASKNNGIAALVPFVYGTTDSGDADAYVLEFGPSYMRVFRSHAQVMTTGPAIYELATPFVAAELATLQFYQSGNAMWIVSGSRWPQRLVRSGHDSWAIADAPVLDGPFLDLNATTLTVTPSATAGNGITLTASSGLFKETHEGSLFKVQHTIGEQKTTGTLTGTGASSVLLCGTNAEWEFSVTGYGSPFVATLEIEYSTDGGSSWSTWRTITFTGASASIPAVQGTNLEGVSAQVRVNCTAYTSGWATYQLAVPQYEHVGIVRIGTVATSTSATADVVDALGSTLATSSWAFCAWSDECGYPRAITANGGRLWYGGTTYRPLGLWGSKTNQFDSFAVSGSALATDSIAVTLTLAEQSPIQWLNGNRGRALLVGMADGVQELLPADPNSPYSPTNPPSADSSDATPCSRQTPVFADNCVLFIHNGGKRMYEMYYSSERESIVAADLCILADHVGTEGLEQAVVAKGGDNMIWIRRGDGSLAALTFKSAYGVSAWHHHVLGGGGVVLSMAQIPGDDGPEVWLLVERTLGGATKRYIEYMRMPDADVEYRDSFYVDCGVEWNGGDAVNITGISRANPAVVSVDAWPVDSGRNDLADGDNIRIAGVAGPDGLNDLVYTVANANKAALTFELLDTTTAALDPYESGGTVTWVDNTFGGMSHLEGEAVVSTADSGASAHTVAGGQIALDEYTNRIAAGFAFTSTVRTLCAEWMYRANATVGKKKKLNAVAFDFYNTLGGKTCVQGGTPQEIVWPQSEYAGDGPSPQTEIVEVGPMGGYAKTLAVEVVQDEPYPMTICGLVPDISIS